MAWESYCFTHFLKDENWTSINITIDYGNLWKFIFISLVKRQGHTEGRPVHRIMKRRVLFEVLGDLNSGGLVEQPPDENSVFDVLRIVSNCRNFFKLVTSGTFPHNPFDTDKPSVLDVYPMHRHFRLTKLKSLSLYQQVWMGKYFQYTLRTTIISKK